MIVTSPATEYGRDLDGVPVLPSVAAQQALAEATVSRREPAGAVGVGGAAIRNAGAVSYRRVLAPER